MTCHKSDVLYPNSSTIRLMTLDFHAPAAQEIAIFIGMI